MFSLQLQLTYAAHHQGKHLRSSVAPAVKNPFRALPGVPWANCLRNAIKTSDLDNAPVPTGSQRSHYPFVNQAGNPLDELPRGIANPSLPDRSPLPASSSSMPRNVRNGAFAGCGHRPPSTGVHSQTGPVRIYNLRVGTCTDPTGSDSHRSGSEAIERVSQLSLVLTPRCPRFGRQTRGG